MGTAFETEMGVMPELSKAVQEMDWILPTDIQSEAVPMILGGGDVLMAAETGSGKTGAFCLPVLQIVYETLKDLEEGKGKKRKAGGGGGSSSGKWKMNVFDRSDAMAIDPETGLCQSRDQQKWHGCRSNKGVRGAGRYYYEAEITDEGLCRIGWSSLKASMDLGTDKEGLGFGGTGKKSFGRQFDSYGEPFGLKDVIGCFLDLDNNEIKWSKNGVDLGKAFDVPGHMLRSPIFASICLKNAELDINFGDRPFRHMPKGWTPLSKAKSDNVVPSSITGAAQVANQGPKSNAPMAIIMEPSRELAEQTYEQIRKFKKHMPEPVPRELLIVGGANARDQVTALQRGVDVVVATPGRLEDLINTQTLSLSSCRFFILDECDGLLSAGYGDFIKRVHDQIPKVTADGKRLQMVVCSATLHSFDVKKMAERLMHFPVWIDLKGQDSVPETVHHCVCIVDPSKDTSWKQMFSSQKHIRTDGVHQNDRISPNYESAEMHSEAIKILKGKYVVRAIEEHKMDKALIFCRTKLDCDNLEQHFISMGGGPNGRNKAFSCVCLHSDRKPPERKGNLERFKRGDVRFLICTDVAARGIDITGLPYVINVTLPDEKQNYIHRIGRVGRAERMGLALSFAASVKEKVWYHSNCNTRGRGCFNTNLTDHGGCCIWYNEPQLLADVEEHLGVTIDQIESDMKVPTNEFDGKVVYGEKLRRKGFSDYKDHVSQMAPAVRELADLEKRAQISYVTLRNGREFK